MHGDELKYITEAYETNWMSTVGANINSAEAEIAAKVGCKYVRYASEKLFRSDKSFLGNKSLRIDGNDAASSKIFIEFIALILRCRLYTCLKEKYESISEKPEIQVHPLGIGGKDDPARLVFDGVTGDGIQCTLIDLGDHFRIICADIELVKQPQSMPKLPVARIMYRHKPNFEIGTAAWCYAGGAHHSVVSTALKREDIALFAKLTGTELVTIGDDTTEADLAKM